MEIREVTLSEWKEALPGSGYEVFHRPEALSVIEEHAPGFDLRLYGGFKGQQVIALLPLYVRRLPFGVRAVTSPPPGMHIPHLGPVVMPASPKQRKIETVNNRFTESLLDELGLDTRALFYMICSPEYDDPRPFVWADHSVNVSFTYNLFVEDQTPEEVIQMFSRSQRREIRKARDLDVDVETGTIDDAKAVYEQTQDRFSEQNEYFGLSWSLVRDLFEALGDRARVYVVRGPDGGTLSGVISLYSNDAASFWLGGVRSDYENVSMNTLLHWNIIRDIAEDPDLGPVSRYDMVGAGEYRLSRYKSKFNPRLRRYYVVDSGGLKMWLAKAAYEAVQAVPSSVPDVRSRFSRPVAHPGSIGHSGRRSREDEKLG